MSFFGRRSSASAGRTCTCTRAPPRSGVFPEKEIDVTGSNCASAADFQTAIGLVRAHREAIAALFSHRFPLTGAREAIECLASSPAGAVKVLVTVGGDA